MATEQQIEIGRHRASLRVRAGLYQSELAERAGVALSTVTSAENGDSIRESNLRALAEALGLSARDYLEPEGCTVAPASASSAP